MYFVSVQGNSKYIVFDCDVQKNLYFFPANAIGLFFGTSLFFTNETKIEVMIEQRNREPDISLSEGLAKAHTFTTQEWPKAQRIARLTFSSKSPLIVTCFEVESRRVI